MDPDVLKRYLHGIECKERYLTWLRQNACYVKLFKHYKMAIFCVYVCVSLFICLSVFLSLALFLQDVA